jgi:hypothetical protein
VLVKPSKDPADAMSHVVSLVAASWRIAAASSSASRANVCVLGMVSLIMVSSRERRVSVRFTLLVSLIRLCAGHESGCHGFTDAVGCVVGQVWCLLKFDVAVMFPAWTVPVSMVDLLTVGGQGPFKRSNVAAERAEGRGVLSRGHDAACDAA